MKVSGFTFIKNGQILGYPFLESIQSSGKLEKETENSLIQIIEEYKQSKK